MADQDGDLDRQALNASIETLETVELSTHYQESLLYGDSIYLAVSGKEPKSIKVVASFISSSDHPIVTLDEYSYDDKPSPAPDMHMAAFRILGPNKSEAQAELNKFKESVTKNQKLTKEEKNRKFSLEKDVENEITENQIEQKSLLHKEIKYGHVFQLQHHYTNKFLGISDSETALVDKSSLKATLFDTNGEHVQFKISPKYRVCNIGEKIRIDDQIILKNVKSQQYLHISSTQINNSFSGIKSNCYEVNASAVDSPFSIYSHIKLQQEDELQTCKNIRGGSVLRLYHLHAQCYVVASGSCGFEEFATRVVTDDVHLRKRKEKNGELKPPSTSAISYWEIELARAPLSGDELKYRESCRFKHLLTQRYLSITKEPSRYIFKLIKLEDDSGTDTTFYFTPFINEGNEKIDFSSYARIYHPGTKSWIKATNEEGETVSVEQPDNSADFRWDTANCFQILAEPSKGYQEAFTLEEVDPELLSNFRYVMGYLPIIGNYLKNYDGKTKTTTEMEKSLQSLANWILDKPDKRVRKNRQKLLRNLGIIKLLMEIQDRFREISVELRTGQNYERRENATKIIYKVIEAYLVGQSRKNENYTYQFIEIFESHFDFNINAEETLIELVRDNKTIINQLTQKFEKSSHELYEKLEKKHNSQIFYYFSVMCVADKNPIPENQIVLANQLEQKYLNLLFLMKLDENSKVLGFSPLYPEGYKLLSDYVSKNDPNTDTKTFSYLLAQLDFLAKLCEGNNERAIEVLRNQFSFEVLFAGLNDEQIHPQIRTKFALLINTMYIDVGSNRAVLENFNLTFEYEKCVENLDKDDDKDGENDDIALSGEKNEYFPQMKVWFLEYFKELVIYGKDFVYTNELTTAVLEMVILLTKFGYYDNQIDADALLKVLINILNGKRDRYANEEPNAREQEWAQHSHFQKSGRYKVTKDNAPIFKIKILCLHIFELFMNYRFLKRLQRLLFLYRVVRKEVSFENPRNFLDQSPEDVLGRNLQQLHDPKFNIHENANLSRNAVNQLSSGILDYATYEFESYEGENKFESILLDLTQYGNKDVVNTSLRLLDNQYRVENNLFEKAIQTQVLITRNSIDFFDEINRNLPEFRRLLKKSFTKRDSWKPLHDIMEKFCHACELPNDDTEVHPQNQKILYNLGILADLLNLLERIEKTLEDQAVLTNSQLDKGDNEGPTRLAKVSCKLLQRMAQDNNVVQQRLYNRIQILVNPYLFDTAPKELADLLTQLFTAAQDIVLNVKESDINLICSLMEKTEKLQNIPPILSILKAITKVEEIDLPLHFNQVHIMNSFITNKPKRIETIQGAEEEKSERRGELLNREKPRGDDLIDLNLMLSTYDLMASLCEGENLHHESVCQTMITLEELLDILNNKKLPFDRKFQFASFFNWVYLNTHKVSYGFDGTINDNPQFWEFLENSRDLLSTLITYLDKYPPQHVSRLKKSLSQQSEVLSDFDSDCGQKSSMLYIASIDYGLINYLMKGMLPIIIVYYQRYFSTNRKDLEALKKYDHLLISVEICNKLIDLSIMLQPYIAKQHQVKMLYNAALSILTHPDIKLLQEFDSYFDVGKLTTFSELVDKEDNFVAQAIKAYQEDYQAEIELNSQFNNYVKNLRRAYWRKNTVEDQIGGNHNSKYSEYIDPLCEHPLPDSMPLGPSFQNHLALFFPRTEGSCEVKKEAKSLVQQLIFSYKIFNELTERQKLKQERLDIKSLQLLRGAIYNEIFHIDPKLKEQNLEKYRTEFTKVRNIQDSIEGLDNTSNSALIISLIDHPNKIVSSQSIALLKDMLCGGNNEIQSKLEAMTKKREGKFLEQMSDILAHGRNSVSGIRSLTEEIKTRGLFLIQMRETLKQRGLKLTDQSEAQIMSDGETRGDKGEKDSLIYACYEIPSIQEEIELKSLQQDDDSLDVQSSTEDSQSAHLRFKMIQNKDTEISQLEIQAISDLRGESFQCSLHNIKLAFDLMGFMCDGQQTIFQNYFRDQPENLKSINMVTKIVQFLKVFCSEINKQNIDLITQAFKTLTEFVSGNFQNQKEAFMFKIIDIVNQIFQKIIFKQCSIKDTLFLYDSIIRMLQVMVEETSVETKGLARDISSSLDFASVHRIIDLLNDIREKKGEKDIRDLAEDDMFRYFHFLIQLQDFECAQQPKQTKKYYKIIPLMKDPVWKAWEYCEKRSRSVEITYITEDDVHILNKVHFKSLKYEKLRDEVQEKVKWGVKRGSPAEKLRDHLDWFKAVKIDQNYHNKLKHLPIVNFYIMPQLLRKHLFLLWSVIMNLLLLSTWLTPCTRVETTTVNDILVYECAEDSPNSSLIPPILPVVPSWYFYVFFPLGAIHLLMALDLLVLFYIVNWINFYIPIPSIISNSKYIKVKIPGFKIKDKKLKIEWKDPPEERYLQINIIGSKVIFIWVIFFSSLLSLPFRGYFYPISLLYILESSDILRRVLQAVTKNGKSLLYVAIFGVIILYIFSVIAFALFYQQAQSTINPESEKYVFCRSLYECAISIGRWGLLETIGLILPQRSMEFAQELVRIIYDVAFFIIISTIGLNIVFGIIVDTFSELRDEKYTQENDMKSVCFICGIENYLFDRKGNGFKEHVNDEHNMWDYFSFFFYLNNVDPSDHTAIESFVFKHLRNGKIRFFPQNAARCLTLEEDETLGDKLEEQSKLLKEMMAKINKLEKNKSL